jgi:SAM-dependent methyltransferase
MEQSPESRSSDNARATWQLPAGVSRGTWDYATKPEIATEYDQFHAGHPLLDLDRKLIAEHLGESAVRTDGTPRVAVDFGCGTGRNLLPLAEKGWRVVGVDLSVEMLREFKKKSEATPREKPALAIRANMANAECFASDFADAVLCMYSSLGMVKGQANRRSFLKHANRILTREGKLIVHVHNRGSWLRDPGGIGRSVSGWLRARRDRDWEFGDSVYAYRGLPSMFLHLFSESEFRWDLKSSGFRIERLYRLNRQSSSVLKLGWLSHLRSGGFLAVCQPIKVMGHQPQGASPRFI